MAHDLRGALRAILSHRWFSAAVVATLALGIGLNTMVFTLVNAVLLKPLAVPHGERIVVLSNSNLAHNDDSMRISYPDFRDYRAQVSSVESMEAASDVQAVLSERGNPPAPYHMEHATAGLFDMLHIPVSATGLEDARSQHLPGLVVSHEAWLRYFGGDAHLAGRVLAENG